MFFPGRKFPFWYTQNKITVVFKTEKQKKKKKKRSSPLFTTFPTSISNFPPSLLQFYNFPSYLFSIFTHSPFFSPIHQSKNFPVRSLWRHSAPFPPPVTTGLYSQTASHSHVLLARHKLRKLREYWVKLIEVHQFQTEGPFRDTC